MTLTAFLFSSFSSLSSFFVFFFFNDTATTEIYTLSLHDALPICPFSQIIRRGPGALPGGWCSFPYRAHMPDPHPASPDRKSTRLNSSHDQISYAVFCLKKKKKKISHITSMIR